MEYYASNYDVICCSETWLTSAEAAVYQIKDFSHHFCCRSAPYGGVSVFVKHSVDTLEVRSEQTLDQRVQSVSLRIRISGSSFWLTSVYSCNASCVGALDGLLKDLIETLRSPMVLVGDLNIDLLSDHSSSRQLRCALEALDLYPLHCLITRPSSGTCLDHLWVSNDGNLAVRNVVVSRSLELSDHYPIFFELSADALTLDLG